MKRKETQRGNGGSEWQTGMIGLLKGSMAAVIAAVILLLLSSAAVAGGILPERWLGGLAMASCGAGCMIGGSYARGSAVLNRWLLGALFGVMVFLIFSTAGLLLYGELELERGGAGIFSACLCGSMGGALIGKREKKKGVRTTRKRKRL